MFWLSGCPFTCDGCIVEELQNGSLGSDITPKKLYKQIEYLLDSVDGVTFSGGEPLYQSAELQEFINILPTSMDKMLFTGYSSSELNEEQKRCYELFDLVVEERFEKDKMGSFLWRGSSNQKILSPTKKYNDIIDDILHAPSAGLHIDILDKEILYYGIPTKNNEIEKIEKMFYKKIR